ncbi:hypothetical protein ONZ43_g6760 [Nemania bipapillata]|uniref:Uncharacterized protein n=1 Tax=Nemania bipapillata TaxID=110536 RepID=A0ACC2HWV9_9PEZI|nr:hypothetical protein ONZ43_g6760 [Nemania bipapillata]
MHTGQKITEEGVKDLIAKVSEIKRSMVEEHAINASARIQFRQSLTDIQLGQVISFLSKTTTLDATESLQTSTFLRNKRRSFTCAARGPRFWLRSEMETWNRTQHSSLIMIVGTRKVRFHIRDFCTDSILSLRESRIPVIWALKAMDFSPQSGEAEGFRKQNEITTIEILKCLVTQAIQLNMSLHTDAALAPRVDAYHAARTEGEWLDIFASVVQGFPKLYIFVDLELLRPESMPQSDEFCWPAATQKVLDELSRRGCSSIVKIALVSYGSRVLQRTAMGGEGVGAILRVGRAGPGGVRPQRQSTSAPRRGRVGGTPSYSRKIVSSLRQRV